MEGLGGDADQSDAVAEALVYAGELREARELDQSSRLDDNQYTHAEYVPREGVPRVYTDGCVFCIFPPCDYIMTEYCIILMTHYDSFTHLCLTFRLPRYQNSRAASDRTPCVLEATRGNESGGGVGYHVADPNELS